MRQPLVLVLNGPNLDRLGEREPHRYGTTTLAEIEATLRGMGDRLGVAVDCVQAASAAALLEAVAARRPDAIVVNPASLTHYSFALRDGLAAAGVAVFEVHITNIYAREPYRRHSVVSGIARGAVVGLGVRGYRYALEAAAEAARERSEGSPT